MAEYMGTNPYVPNVHFSLIPINQLVSNQTYQRPISNAHVGRTAQNFDVYQINPVKVSRRNGTNYVFDGQHTIETVAIASGSRDTPVWCMIYDDLGYEQEADIFANQKKQCTIQNLVTVFIEDIFQCANRTDMARYFPSGDGKIVSFDDAFDRHLDIILCFDVRIEYFDGF